MDQTVIVFDTETTGLPKSWKAKMTDVDNWPRVIQLAWAVISPAGETIRETCVLIRPDGWEIPNQKFWIDNGFTTEGNKAKGIPLKNALLLFIKDLNSCNGMVAHNMAFDYPVLGAEMIRLGMRAKRKLPQYCTMQSSIDHCNLPRKKFPKLEELHHILFDECMEGAHDAMNDVRACAKCYVELVRLGLITPTLL